MSQIVPYEVIHQDTTKVGRPVWLRSRKPYLCSSDVAAWMGMSHYATPYSVYCDKLDLVPEQGQNDYLAWKLRLETPILDYAIAEGWVSAPMERHLMIRSVEYPWLAADPDGLTPDEVVEAKAMHGMDEKRWDDGIPDMYAVQTHVQMIVSGRRRAVVPVMFGNDPPRRFDVEFDEALAARILESTEAGWQQIQDRIEPDALGGEATAQALKARYYEPKPATSVDLGEDTRQWFGVRNACQGVVAKELGVINDVKSLLKQRMGNATEARLDGELVATWKPRKDGVRVFLFAD